MRSDFKVTVSKDYLVFSSAHFITFRGHQCETLHGHNYRVGVTVEGSVDDETMFVVDFSILKKIILSRFANTFAMLYAAGIPILDSIRSTQDIVGNRVVSEALRKVEQSISDGQNVASAFHDAGLFPPLVVRMLRIGENTGGLDKALLNVSYFYNRDVKESVDKAQTLIEPMLTVFMGALLGWIMLSVIGPIYDVISKIKT